MCCHSPFFPHPLSLSSLHSHHFSHPSTLFSHLNPHQFFISLPPSLSLSLSLSPTIFTPPYSLFFHPTPTSFHLPPTLSLSLSLPPLPPFFTPLPLSLSPPPLVLTFLPLSLLSPPLSYPPNCQYTLAYGLNDLCTEVSAELFMYIMSIFDIFRLMW